MLGRFLNPRWQHPDPETRRQAVAALSPEADGDALAHVAREDPLPAIRRLALRAAVDLDLLEERARRDSDAGVREQAVQRYRELLAGLVESGPPLDERMQRAARSTDPALIEYLARTGKDDALRAHALTRVERETVLRDVALGDAALELRLSALARIQDEALLAKIQENSRKTDKRVSHAARERLDVLREARERPQRVATECGQICDALEGLGRDGQLERDAQQLDGLEQRWRTLDAALRERFEARYAAARERFRTALAASRANAGASRTARQAILARLEPLTAAPTDDERAAIDDWIEVRETALREGRVEWDASERLPAADEHALEQRWHAAETSIRTAIACEQQRRALARLLAEHDRLVARRDAVAESDVKALGRAIDELGLDDAPHATLATLSRRVRKAHARLRDRLREQAGWKKDTLAALPARLQALQVAVTEGRAGKAVAAHDAIAADLERLLAAGTSTERLAKARKRLATLGKDVKIMRAWSVFGANAARERLCEQMETLADAGEPPPVIARKVREARAEWKALAKNGEGVDQALWRRFDAAATRAYAPCKAYFAERADTRKANLEARQVVLEALQRFLEDARGGADVDWKAAVRLRRELLQRWRDAHPVERGPGKALAAGFETSMAELDALLGRERERSLRRREQLIAEAEALAGSTDKKSAAEACKGLQRQWKVTVPGTRGQENALWERFRGACDAVFGERQQVFDAERASARAGLEQRDALCQRVEALIGTDALTVDEAERELHRIQGEWSRCAAVPRREAEAVEKRFTAAVRRFAKHKRALEAQRRREDLELMRSKAALCHEAECLAGGGTADPHATTTLQGRWQALRTLADDDAEASLAQRFEQALTRTAADTAEAGDDSPTDNLSAREALCLRLEILARVDSPPEHAQARMALQVQRLANALAERGQAGAESPEALLRAWCTAGPAPREHAQGLEARFQRAWTALASGAQDGGS